MDRSPTDLSGLRVLVVEDDEIMAMSLVDRLRLEGIDALGLGTVAEARARLARGDIDLVVSDIRLPDGTGRDLFEEAGRQSPGLPFLLMTAYGSVADAVALVKAGAIDYLEKPFDLPDFIRLVRRHLTAIADTRRHGGGDRFRLGIGLFGQDPSVLRIERTVARLHESDAAVLVSGERGLGKKRLALLVHRTSRRAAGPFVEFDCRGVRAPGAFEADLTAAIAAAEGGTLYCQGVEEIVGPRLSVFVRLFPRPHGDARVVSTRLVEGGEEAADGGRADRIWDLHGIHIRVPPLRERPDDILHVARMLLTRAAAAAGRRIEGFSPAAEEFLTALRLPGNGHDLKAIVDQALVRADGRIVERHHLQDGAAGDCAPIDLRSAVEEAERGAILAALAYNDHVIGKTADSLGISRKNLWEKMRRYGLDG